MRSRGLTRHQYVGRGWGKEGAEDGVKGQAFSLDPPPAVGRVMHANLVTS